MTPGAFRIFSAMCRDAGLPEPRREWEFSGSRNYRFDLCWPSSDHMLAMEVDGGIWLKGGGRHNRPKGYLNDLQKKNLAAIEGWRIIYTTPDKLHTQETIELVRQALYA